MKHIGISMMCYWGDQFEDIASGNNFFLADLVNALNDKGYIVHWMQDDLDKKKPQFKNFLVKDRRQAYNSLIHHSEEEFPRLDILLIEWRWPMEGRNVGKGATMNDYTRQLDLLEHYEDKPTKIFILDSDHKLEPGDIENLIPKKSKILSFDLFPKDKNRHYVYWPFDDKRLESKESLVHAPWSGARENINTTDPNFIMSYIGNNYERDEEFDFWVGEMSKTLPEKTIHVYGNWCKYSKVYEQCTYRYPRVMFHPKVTKAEMEYIYSRSLCVPLIAKPEYNRRGHMTHRLLEAMYCGTLPIGFTEFQGIRKYVIDELVVENLIEFNNLLDQLAHQTHEERLQLWKKQIDQFQYGPSNFIRTIEEA